MKKTIKIIECYHRCPFYVNTMDGMSCNHPYWNDKEAYENMIITQDNSRDGNIPEKCPLKKEQLTIVYELDKNNYNDFIISELEDDFYEKWNNCFIKVNNHNELDNAQLWWKEKGFNLIGARTVEFPLYIGVIDTKLEFRKYEMLNILKGIKIITLTM